MTIHSNTPTLYEQNTNYCLHFLSSHLQVEVIGGADKYMAVCRDCYKIPGDGLTSISLGEPSEESSDQKTPTSADNIASAKSRGRVLFPIENTKMVSTGEH